MVEWRSNILVIQLSFEDGGMSWNGLHLLMLPMEKNEYVETHICVLIVKSGVIWRNGRNDFYWITM